MKRILNKSTIGNLENVILEDIEDYIVVNKIDDDTAGELKFIGSAFAKYYKSAVDEGKDDETILKDFDSSMMVLQKGAFGTSFITFAPNLYKDIYVINKVYT